MSREKLGIYEYLKKHSRGITAAVTIAAASAIVLTPSETNAQNPSDRPAPTRTPALRFSPTDSIRPNQQVNPEHLPPPIFAPKPVASPPTENNEWTNTVRLTFYCLKDTPTFTGTSVRDGVISVDPTYIPLGSLVDIEGHGRNYSAEDTGLKVKGWHIDMWKHSCDEAIELGSQTRRIRVKRLSLLTTPDNLVAFSRGLDASTCELL